MTRAPSLAEIRKTIIACRRCPRLRQYCTRIARDKRAAFRGQTYWGRPVPGFGDPRARIIIVGLAPAAHGANRTGRMFTGDGSGGSGDFLMAALSANRLSNHPFSRDASDGLELYGAWLLAAVRCAPPANKPSPREVSQCYRHFRAEVEALTEARVFVALGRLAFDASWRLLKERGWATGPRPRFAHGAVYLLGDGLTLIASYHPSRQNTHTRRLTPAMLREVFEAARRRAGLPPGPPGPQRI